MRVALLSLTEIVSGASAEVLPRGLLAFGPGAIADTQLDFVLALGCERIICIGQGIQPGLIGLQRHAENAGAQFHLIRSARNLASLVKQADELIVLADGLLPLDEDISDLLSQSPLILTFPAEPGVARGFERIDLTRAWAGAMKLPGGLAERLSELPEDADVISSLLRIALQARLPEHLLPEALLADGHWSLVQTEADARQRESLWVRRQTVGSDRLLPGRWAGGQIAARFGPRLMQKGFGAVAIAAASLVLLAVALLLGRFGNAAAGLLAFVPAAVMLEAALAAQRLERAARHRRAKAIAVMRGLLDIALVALLAFAVTDSVDWQAQLFAPLMVMGLTLLVPIVRPDRWTRLAVDRAILSFVAAFLTTAEVLLPFLQGYGVALLAVSLFYARDLKKLTRT